MDVSSITLKQKINKGNASIILENQSFTISKKVGHVVIKLSTIGKNFKNYQPVQLENTLKTSNKVPNFSNLTQFKMPQTH
jgi:hypothetical protein